MSRGNRFRLTAAVPENDEIRMTNGEGMTKSELAHDASDKVFWNSDVPSIVREKASDKGVVYDLEERTARFGAAVIVRVLPELKPRARILWTEAKELHPIFSKIWRTGKNE